LAPEAEFDIDDSQIYRIGNSIIENNKIIELNAKYVRPPLHFLQIFIKLGVKFHVGSDAHRLKDIGDFYRIMPLINLIEQ
jgi:histidinol phosphatase-like PHP family hydrolase